MHLITGLILAGMMSKKKSRKTLPFMYLRGPIETAHYLPGRLRLRVSPLVANDSARKALEEHLPKIQGVSQVSANTVSGSVLIVYKHSVLQPEILFTAVAGILGLQHELEKTPPSRVGREIGDVAESVNRAVYDATHGIIDLWTGVPLILILLAVRGLWTGGTAKASNPYTLLWWAYVSLLRGGRGAV